MQAEIWVPGDVAPTVVNVPDRPTETWFAEQRDFDIMLEAHARPPAAPRFWNEYAIEDR